MSRLLEISPGPSDEDPADREKLWVKSMSPDPRILLVGATLVRGGPLLKGHWKYMALLLGDLVKNFSEVERNFETYQWWDVVVFMGGRANAFQTRIIELCTVAQYSGNRNYAVTALEMVKNVILIHEICPDSIEDERWAFNSEPLDGFLSSVYFKQD